MAGDLTAGDVLFALAFPHLLLGYLLLCLLYLPLDCVARRRVG